MEPYAKVSAGHVISNLPNSGGIGFIGEIGAESTNLSCSWTHFSMVNRGRPLHGRNDPEPVVDWLGCGYKFGGK